jgi:phage recombination protein Bet
MTIATTETSHGLAVSAEQDWWSEKQLAALRQIGVDRASNGDLAVFMHVCQRTGLDPFARQIYMILRDGKQVIQTGIDGMRLVARRAVDRNREAFSISAPEWCGSDGKWTDVWLSDGPPAAARVTVTRGEGTFTAVALWQEYVQTKRDGGITRMWATRGAGQLAKCAEALALRKACPQDLSGIYSDDEMAREPRAQQPTSGIASVVQQAAEPEPPTDGPTLLDTRSDLASDLYRRIDDLGIADNERIAFIVSVIDRPIGSTKELTEDEARAVLAHIDQINEPVDAKLVEDAS